MLTIFLRTIILYIAVVGLLRAMGKREIGQMQPYELVVTLMIADFAAAPLDNVSTPLLNGIMPVIALVLANSVMSLLIFKCQGFKRFFTGRPALIVRNGRIDRRELERQALTVSDLMVQVRLAGCHNVFEVGVAILEPSGQMSIFPISGKRPPNADEVGVATGYETVPLTLIVDGKLQSQNMGTSVVNERWVRAQLKKIGAAAGDVLLMSIDSSGMLQAQLRDESAPLIFRKALEQSEVSW